jgi:hypothetical protein
MTAAEPSPALLQTLLDLSDDELLEILGSTPLDVMTGEEDEREDVRVLVQMTREAADAEVLARWVRANGPLGRPLDLLLARDFAGYERALTALRERGFVVRGGG